MKKSKKEAATERVKLFPSTKKKIKILAAQKNTTMANIVHFAVFSKDTIQATENVSGPKKE